MYFEKRYLQFNDLVFDGYDMISDYDEPLQFKGTSTAYSYGHGSYMPVKNDYLYVSERQVNMTLTLKLKKLQCEYRGYYVRFALQELSKPGKLWAIRGNEILWANARVNNIRPVNNGKKDLVVFDLEFVVPGGVWHKADKQKTFLLPYNLCAYMECKGFEDYNPCGNAAGSEEDCTACDTNHIAMQQRDDCGCCCDDDIAPNMALCFHQDELQAFYGCETPYQLKYDCVRAEKYNSADAFGQKFCLGDFFEESTIAGRFYSETDIPTEDMTITLVGRFTNPWITINDNTNIIMGEYDGKLVIHGNGEVYYAASDCCEPQLLDPSVWVIPSGMDFGWTIYPQVNSIIVHTNECCNIACAFIYHEAITT